MIKGIKLSFTGTFLALISFAAVLVLSSLVTPARADSPGTSTQETGTSTATASSGTTTSGSAPAGSPAIPAVTFQYGTLPANGEPGANAGPAFAVMAGGNEFQGEITKIENNGAKITINNFQTINLNDQTVIGDADGALKQADLKVGDRLMAIGKTGQDKSLTARWVLKLEALPVFQFGKISSIDPATNSFKFKSEPDSIEWTATVNSDTRLNNAGKDITLGDLKVGDQVLVSGKADWEAHKIEAAQVQSGMSMAVAAKATVAFFGGKVKSIDLGGNSFTLDNDLKVVVDSSTQFGDKDVKSLADLKVGDQLAVTGDKQDDGSIKAKTVSPMTTVNLTEGQTFSTGAMVQPFTVSGSAGAVQVVPAQPQK